MAANYIVINSKFKPFSYAEMLQPVQMATLAHQEVENEYADLATKANVWDEMANEQTDPYAYKMYKTYSNDLEEQAGQLAREGLTPASRQNMLRMKQRYSSDIVPIEQAYKRRQELIDEQRKLLAQDNTLMFDRNASMLSLDDLIKNPQLTYQLYSGATLAKQVGTAAQNLAKEMRENPRKWRSILGNQYFETIMQHGYRPEEIIQVLQNDPNASSVLKGIVEDAVGSSNIARWGDQDTLNRAYEYARQGLWNAVGEAQYQTIQNQDYLNPLQELQRKNLERQLNPTPSSFAINPSNIYSSRELSKDEKVYNDNIRKFSNYFYTDAQGRTRLSEKGMDEYRRNAAQRITSTGSGSGTARLMNVETQMQNDSRFVPTEFKKFMDSIGMNPKQGEIDNWNDVAIGDLWQKYVNEVPAAKTAKYDATKTSEYIYDVPQSPTYQQNYKAKLSRVIGSTEKFKEVDYDSKSNQWVPTGETLSFSDFDTDDYNVIARAPSELGTTLFIKKKGEKAKRYLAPPGINITAEGGRDQAISEMLSVQRMLLNPNLTPQQREKLENYYDSLTQQQMMFESQLDITNETKNQSFNPYYIP